MTKFHQIAILRILNDNEDVIINENRNGVHVNLTDLNSNVTDKLVEYVKFDLLIKQLFFIIIYN